MKKVLFVTLVLAITAMCVSGCTGSSLEKAGFTKATDGTYSCLDTSSSPLPQGGVKIEVTTGTSGTVKFIVTDTAGTETVDYYQFTPSSSTMLRHRYVSGMGMTYNYYYDYAAGSLIKVTNDADEDVSDGMKQSGRWDSAASETKEHADSIISYFDAKFKMTMAEAVKK